MSALATAPDAVVVGVAACTLALFIGTYLMFAPGVARLSLERRRPGATPVRTLTRGAVAATTLIDAMLRRRGADGGAAALEQAGLKIRLQDFILLVIASTLAAVAVGFVVAGPLAGLALGLAVPLLAKVALRVLSDRRQRAFADQLDDSLQLLASSLRAGHSLLQALNSVSREAEEPTAGEFARIINETRVGRQLGDALEETGQRMNSKDFGWVIQAIAINREVGGNLAEVLDGVGHTIRERNQVLRQVKALAAEGKLSALVLMALPVGIVAFLSVSNPAYLGKLTHSLAGYAMIGAAFILLVVGGLWLRKVVTFKF